VQSNAPEPPTAPIRQAHQPPHPAAQQTPIQNANGRADRNTALRGSGPQERGRRGPQKRGMPRVAALIIQQDAKRENAAPDTPQPRARPARSQSWRRSPPTPHHRFHWQRQHLASDWGGAKGFGETGNATRKWDARLSGGQCPKGTCKLGYSASAATGPLGFGLKLRKS